MNLPEAGTEVTMEQIKEICSQFGRVKGSSLPLTLIYAWLAGFSSYDT